MAIEISTQDLNGDFQELVEAGCLVPATAIEKGKIYTKVSGTVYEFLPNGPKSNTHPM